MDCNAQLGQHQERPELPRVIYGEVRGRLGAAAGDPAPAGATWVPNRLLMCKVQCKKAPEGTF